LCIEIRNDKKALTNLVWSSSDFSLPCT